MRNLCKIIQVIMIRIRDLFDFKGFPVVEKF